MLSSLIYELRRTDKKVGVATLCMGTGAGSKSESAQLLCVSALPLLTVCSLRRGHSRRCRVKHNATSDLFENYSLRRLLPLADFTVTQSDIMVSCFTTTYWSFRLAGARARFE